MTENNSLYITSLKQMIALGFLGVGGNISPFILPLIVGALVDHVNFSIQQASYIASADMFGLGIGTLIWSQFVLKGNWMKFAFASAILMCVGNMLCAVADTFYAVAVSRFIAGIGAGLMLTIGVSGLANTKNPDRVVAIYAMLVTLVASAVLYVFPFLLLEYSSKGMFFAMSGFAIVAGISSFFIPKTSTSSAGQGAENAKADASVQAAFSVRLMGVLGVFVVFFGMSLFWVYIERAGVTAGFVTAQISAGLGTAQSAGIAGALAAAIIATRFGGRMLPVMFTIILSLTASVLIPTSSGFAYYLFAASALIFCWNMLYPYVIGIMISLDPTAKLVAYSLVMMTLGKSLSPILGSVVVTETDYSAAYWICGGVFILAGILFTPALLSTDRKIRAHKKNTDDNAYQEIS